MRTHNGLRNLGFVMAVVLLAAWPAASQMGMRPPDFRGVWNPTIGSGAAYQMDGKGGKNEMEITVVGKEDVDGQTGYWVEMSMNPPNGGGPVYAKNLMVMGGKTPGISRMIMQMPGQPPMEMPGMVMNRQAPPPPTADVRDQAEHVGTENVTTPAGTFSCEHYKAKDGKWEAWLSPKVTPWGLVKSTSGDTTMTVTRVISDAKDHITGTPQKMDLGNMGRPN